MADGDQGASVQGEVAEPSPNQGRTGSAADTTDSEAAQQRTHKAFDASNAPEPGPQAPVADEERDGVSSTDTEPDAAHGVGESTRRSGEDIAPERDDVEHKGPADRPAGKVADDAAF